MIPAPLLAVVRYVVVYACGKAAGHGWDFFNWGPDVTDAVVQIITMALAGLLAYFGAAASTVRRIVGRLRDHHRAALLDGAASVPGVTKIEATQELALATESNKVVAGGAS